MAGGAIALIVAGMAGAANPTPTDFGIRILDVPRSGQPLDPSLVPDAPARGRLDIGSAVGIGSRWGRVTSTLRSVAHNRRVGGVINSYHLSGRAIDIARRPGVAHHQIAAALRAAGYHLIESLDEGDHSHFAFGAPGSRAPSKLRPQMVLAGEGGATQFRIIYAPTAR